MLLVVLLNCSVILLLALANILVSLHEKKGEEQDFAYRPLFLGIFEAVHHSSLITKGLQET